MPLLSGALRSEYHTRKFVKCKYCEREAGRNVVANRNKGHLATCGSVECLNAHNLDPQVNAKKIYRGERICEKCHARYIAFGAKQKWCRTCVPNKNSRAIMRRYNISLPEYTSILMRTDGKCPICRSRKACAVDHCHRTGKIRGILCNFCNMILSVVENPELLKSAQEYLAKYV